MYVLYGDRMSPQKKAIAER